MGNYTPDEKTVAKTNHNFSYHAPKGDQVQRYGLIRDAYKALATLLNENCPPSRELSVSLTELETSCFWANASIARNE